jgi:hypothetical protein
LFKESIDMAILRFRITGNRGAVDDLLARLHSIDKIDRLEEVDDEIPTMRDDSSSTDSADDDLGETYRIEIHAPDHAAKEMVQDVIEVSARDLDAAIEFVDRF